MSFRCWTIRASILLGLGIVLAACGDSDSDSSSNGGTGGSAGSGGTGVSGSGGTGTAGSGGTGASGSGGTGDSGSGGMGGDVTTWIPMVCAEQASLPCAMSNCDQDLSEGLAQATDVECGSAYSDMIACLVENPLVCDSNDEAVPPAACDAKVAAMGACVGSSTGCSATEETDGTCSVSCTSSSGSYGANCFPGLSDLNCVCTSGPNASTQFTATGTCASEDWKVAAESTCK